MGRVIIFIALFGLQLYALIDLVRSPSNDVRTLPKPLWLLVWIVPLAGPVAWFVWGRPRVGPAPGGGGGGGMLGGPRPPRGPIAPDDDPEFLKRLDEQSWAARMERLRRERESSGPEGAGQDGAGQDGAGQDGAGQDGAGQDGAADSGAPPEDPPRGKSQSPGAGAR